MVQRLALPELCETLEPGGCTAFRSDSNSNVLTHPAQREAVLEPGGCTTFRGDSVGSMPTPPGSGLQAVHLEPLQPYAPPYCLPIRCRGELADGESL